MKNTLNFQVVTGSKEGCEREKYFRLLIGSRFHMLQADHRYGIELHNHRNTKGGAPWIVRRHIDFGRKPQSIFLP